MQNKKSLSVLLRIVCIVLIAASVTMTFACQSKTPLPSGDTVSATLLGDGAREFIFTVIDPDGNVAKFEIHTDAETVGEALLSLGLIAGEDGAYGLYVKTVNGLTLDYDTDGKYWAFYVGDSYAAGGVDQTEITHGTTYTFRAE